ncbi:hypothetical protein [uncultured Parabacteroides sp.]|uniref:MutS-related protein n=1 Tax=uncultured Parabacteroides sp. TaxID=512312 RepID=UPI00258AF433|nr:hypothetical protein [uncultured Parabacteroides sp.]
MNIWKPWKRTPEYKGEEKTEDYNFFEISSFFRFDKHQRALGVLSEQTCADLGFEDLFMFSDRTVSRVGQQYLYNLMRTIPAGANEVEQNEPLINRLATNPGLHAEVIKDLHVLSAPDAYSIAPLMELGHPVVPVWKKILFRICGLLPTLFLLLFYLYQSGACLFLLIATILMNGVIHYSNKPNNLNYIASIPQLIRLLNLSGKQCKNPLFSEIAGGVPEALSSLETLRKASGHLRMESKMDSDLAVILWAIMECVKVFFLAEPIAYNKVVTLLKDKNRDIETVFRFIGLVDTLSSVVFLRKSLSYYSLPEQPEAELRVEADEMYHPLLENCVANTIRIEGRSILFTGSNMSGKTTFIRTLGVNILVAQTLHTAFARRMKLKMPVMIHAALMLSDSLADGKSFYLKEVESIRDMLSCGQSEHTNLFLLDEIFKGTNTTERIAAAKAVLSYLNTACNIVVVSTHDTELGGFLENEYDLYHFCEKITGDVLSFDYKLKSGNLYQRNAIRILEINDYPSSLIEDAYSVIRQIEGK